jgi:predicted ATP-binding protein involved in virulence
MKISSTLPISVNYLNIKNFRLFTHLEIDLHPELTVLIAPNSGGKTSILDAIKSLLIALIDPDEKDVYSQNDQRKGHDSHSTSSGLLALELSIQKNYLRALGFKTQHYVEKNQDDELLAISSPLKSYAYTCQFLHLETKKHRILAKGVKDINTYINSALNNENTNLPLFAYFTANRRITAQVNKQTIEILDLSRHNAYQALSTQPTKDHLLLFAQWLRERELSGLEARLEMEQEGGMGIPEPNTHLMAVSSILATMLSREVEIKTVKYFAKTKSIQAVTKAGIRLDIDQLSHGAKSILAIVAELAMRCCALNPHLKQHAPSETAGIVLIDEIDLHLHPKWQQHVIADFRQCFPKMQFIITTHSPAVLSTVKKENIREIRVDFNTGKSTANQPLVQSYGESIADTLETIMDVSARPDNPLVRDLNNYLDWAENGDLSEDKQAQRKALENELGKSHTDLSMADLIILRRKILSARK